MLRSLLAVCFLAVADGFMLAPAARSPTVAVSSMARPANLVPAPTISMAAKAKKKVVKKKVVKKVVKKVKPLKGVAKKPVKTATIAPLQFDFLRGGKDVIEGAQVGASTLDKMGLPPIPLIVLWLLVVVRLLTGGIGFYSEN